jgi:integrase
VRVTLSATTLRSALGSAVKRRLVPVNVAMPVELPTSKRTRETVWSARQVAIFLAHVEADRLAAMYQLVVFAGLRRGEAVGL